MNKPKVSKWVKAFWIIGLVATFLWALFSTLLIIPEQNSWITNIFEPALFTNAIPKAIEAFHKWPQEGLAYAIRHAVDDYDDTGPKIISNLFMVGLLIFGYFLKNRACAVIFLLLPLLNFLLAYYFGGLGGVADMDAVITGFVLLFDIFITLLLLFGVIGTTFYQKSIKSQKRL